MTEQIVMVEIEGYNKLTNAVETLRFGDGLAYRTRPSEAPANALYRPFLRDAGWSRIDIYTRPGQYGHVTPGEIVLDDSTGALGAQLINYAFDGRGIVQRIGARGGAYPAAMVTTLNGTMLGQPSFDMGRITFHPADLTAAQDKPLQTARYAGNNVLPAGIEGVDDLKGRVKPIVLALASNMTPVGCNTSKLIYQASIGVGTAAVGVTAVRDKGVPLTLSASAPYVDVADMLANAPAAGQYRVLSSAALGCYIRLGSQPAGAVTLDAAYGAAADRTHAQVWKRLLAYAGVAAGAISAPDVSALDTALSAEIEFAIFNETTTAAACTEVASSARAAWYGDQTGTYRLTQWTAPSGSPVATLNSLRTDTMDIEDPVGNGEIAPAYLVTLSFGKNWTPQDDSNLGGDKTSAADTVRAPGARAGLVARAWLSAEYRTVSATDASVRTAHINAVELKLVSLIANQAAAQTFGDAELALYKVARHMTTLNQWLSPAQIDLVRVGAVVLAKQPFWGYDSGRLMRIAGVQVDRSTNKTQMTLWG